MDEGGTSMRHFLVAEKPISHGGRIREKDEVFEVKDLLDAKGNPKPGTAEPEAQSLIARSYARAASRSEEDSYLARRASPQADRAES
jgi:hypothetical protein